MKFLSFFLKASLISMLALSVLSITLKSKNGDVNLVSNYNTIVPTLGNVIRKNPTLTIDNRVDTYKLEKPSNQVFFSNSNTSSSPNLGIFSKEAELVTDKIYFEHQAILPLVESVPATLGFKKEVMNISSLNKQTGKMENHTSTNISPIDGTVTRVIDVSATTTQVGDLNFMRMGEPKTQVHLNKDFNYNAANNSSS